MRTAPETGAPQRDYYWILSAGVGLFFLTLALMLGYLTSVATHS